VKRRVLSGFILAWYLAAMLFTTQRPVRDLRRGTRYIRDSVSSITSRLASFAVVTVRNVRTMTSFDYVVVGGGTAGCVVAARLSEDPDARVLLLEAGRQDGTDEMSVPAKWLALLGSDVDWGFRTTPQAGLDGVVLEYPRGKVLGGSSGINAMTHVRADRSSYDNWATDGATGWGFEDLLPYFRRSEHAPGRDPRLRGTDGPLTVQRTTNPHPAAEAFFEACQERGYPISADLNGTQSEGVGWFDQNIIDGKRQSSADAYLRPILGRPNLTVLTDALVTGLTFTGISCTGVKYRQGLSDTITVGAEQEVILCAGAIGSPHLLLLSGIGPADHLRQHGVDVVAALPGVGAHLSDHPLDVVVYSASQPVTLGLHNIVDVLAACRVDSSSTSPDAHMLFMAVPFVPPGRTAPEHGYAIAYSMLRPHSRGSVRLASPEPAVAPLIDPAFLTDKRDVEFMVRAARAARELGETHALKAWRNEEVVPGPRVTSDEELAAYLRQSISTYFHAVGTCRMGTGPTAVTDSDLRVHGLARLRIADASVMPSLPSANSNATVLAIAERAADLIRFDG
jgi:choline dehydrogenase